MNNALGTALVTGGAKRLGAGICKHLTKLGYSVALHYNNSENDARDLANKLQPRPQLLQADLSSAEGVQQLWRGFGKHFPSCELLIHNASVFQDDNLANLSYSDWLANLHLHCWTAIASLQILAQQSSESKAILLLDTRLKRNDTDYLSYNLSKNMLADICRRSAAFLAPKVRVNAIAPGPMLPSEADPESFKNKLQSLPVPEQVGLDSIMLGLDYLIQNNSIAGEILYIDGGEHLL